MPVEVGTVARLLARLAGLSEKLAGPDPASKRYWQLPARLDLRRAEPKPPWVRSVLLPSSQEKSRPPLAEGSVLLTYPNKACFISERYERLYQRWEITFTRGTLPAKNAENSSARRRTELPHYPAPAARQHGKGLRADLALRQSELCSIQYNTIRGLLALYFLLPVWRLRRSFLGHEAAVQFLQAARKDNP